MELRPDLTNRRLLSHLPRPKLAKMLATALIAAGAGKAETMAKILSRPALDGGGMTLEEIASVMGVTRQRVREIEQNALRKLRKKAPQSITLLMALAGELDVMRARRMQAMPDGEEEGAA